MKLKEAALKGFPGYRGRRFRLREFKGPIGTNSYWDGGSKNEYMLVNLATGQREMPPAGKYPWCRDEDRGEVESLDEDTVLIWLNIDRGKPYSLSVYCTPECKEKYFPEEEWT